MFLHGILRLDIRLALKNTIIPSTGAAETAVARKTNATEAMKRFLKKKKKKYMVTQHV